MTNVGGPLIYARTATVDFRILTQPDQVPSDTVGAVHNWILPALTTPAVLRNAPIWLQVQDEKYRLVGVACMARDLRPDLPDNYTHDRDRATGQAGRPLYLFAGYVLPTGTPIPSYSALQMTTFAGLYDHVIHAWEDTQARRIEDITPTALPADLPWVSAANVPGSGMPTVDLGRTHDEALVWPNDEGTRRALWELEGASSQPGALYLGLGRTEDVFGPRGTKRDERSEVPVTATVEGVRERTIVRRPAPFSPPQQPRIAAPPPSAPPPRGDNDSDGSGPDLSLVMDLLTPDAAKVIVGVACAAVAAIAGADAVGIAAAGGAGYLAVGIVEMALQQSRSPAGASKSARPAKADRGRGSSQTAAHDPGDTHATTTEEQNRPKREFF